MAVASSDFQGWVNELDHYERQQQGFEDDPRDEGRSGVVSNMTVRSSSSFTKAKPTSISQAEELKQEIKLLNWHKIANEAALKAAIIKTNKLKNEDMKAFVNFGGNLEEYEEKEQRIQQIIEEEQMKPLEVNEEFLTSFEKKEQIESNKMENDIQRHVNHLKKLKQTIEQREEMKKRKEKYKKGIQELQNTYQLSSRTTSASNTNTNTNKNQLEDQQQQHQQKNTVRKHKRPGAMGITASNNTTGQVIGSLDKLMELEKRIRHLENAGLNDDLDIQEEEHTNTSIKFSKRKTVTTSQKEPTKTVYAVSVHQSKAQVCAKAKTKTATSAASATTKKRALQSKQTFLTSVPESRTNRMTSTSTSTSATTIKSKQLRRMNERERRTFLKNEKQKEEKIRASKQDIVIDGWLEKKRQAEKERKIKRIITTSSSTSTSTSISTRGPVQKQQPKVKAPLVGAASGNKIGKNAPIHQQKFENIKKNFEKRKEILNTKTSITSTSTTNNTRLGLGGGGMTSFSSTLPTKGSKTSHTSSSLHSTKLPKISRVQVGGVGGSGGGKNVPVGSGASAARLGQRQQQQVRNDFLPRLTTKHTTNVHR